MLRCANALNRSQKNLHVYVSDSSVSLQFAALGTENVAEVLRLSEKSLPLSDEDSAKLLGMVNPAIHSPKLHGNNGAKAGLSVLRWLAGPGANATKAAPVRRVDKSTHSGADRKARARDSSAWEASLVDAYTSAAAGARAADPDLGGTSMMKFYSKKAQEARKRLLGVELIGGSALPLSSKRQRTQVESKPDTHDPVGSRDTGRAKKRGRGRGRARGRGRGRLFPTLAEFGEGYAAHWAAVRRSYGLDALPLPIELPIAVEVAGGAMHEDGGEIRKLWHLLRMVCENGGGMVCSVHKRWDEIAGGVGVSVEQCAELKAYYDRALLGYELQEDLAATVNVHAKRQRSGREGADAEKQANRRARSAGDNVQTQESKTAVEPTLPPLLTANEKAEIEHAICSGHLGTRLTEAEVRYFSAIANGDSQATREVDTGAATVGTASSASALGVEGEPAALVRLQRRSNETAREHKSNLAARLLRSHDYAIQHTEWTGTRAAGIAGTEQEALLATYVLVRDALMYKWYRSKGRYLTTKDALVGLKKDAKPMAVLAWGYLSLHGHINFGLPMPTSAATRPAADVLRSNCLPETPTSSVPNTTTATTRTMKVVVIGAGLAGLAAALQLQRFGADVELIEARSRVGGRCHTVSAKHGGGELGANFVHGVRGNPLTIVAGQLNQPMFLLGERCPLYKVRGQGPTSAGCTATHDDRTDGGHKTPLVESRLDLQVESRFNRILATTDHWRSERNNAAGRDAREEGHIAAEQRRRSPHATYFAPQALVDQAHKHGSIQHKSLLDDAKVIKDKADAAWKDVPFPPLPSTWANDTCWLDKASLGETITAAAAVTGSTPSEALGDSTAEEEANPGSSACAQQLLNWHLANLEYANGVRRLEDLSLAYWDDDDPWEYRGQHALLPAGFSALCEGLAAEVSCLKLDTEVERVEHEDHVVRVHCKPASQRTEHNVIEADAVIVTVPLGVLKASLPQTEVEQSGTGANETHPQSGAVLRPGLKISPPLSGPQADAVRRLGFGLLNKVVLHFPFVFWETPVMSDGSDTTDESTSRGITVGRREDLGNDELHNHDDATMDDLIGRLCADESRRGEYFQLISMARASGVATLVALVAGQAAEEQEKRTDGEVVQAVMGALRSMFDTHRERQGKPQIPDPLHVEISRWRSDPYSQGSYSYQAVGSSAADREALAGDGNSVALAEASAAANNSSAASPTDRKERKKETEEAAWEMHTDAKNDGATYWWNSVTGESQWTDPHADPAAFWEENIDEKRGCKYWWNSITHESRWTDPTADQEPDTIKEKVLAAAGTADQLELSSRKSDGQPIDVEERTDQTAVDTPNAPQSRWWEGATSQTRLAPGYRVITSYEVDGVMKAFEGTVQHVDWRQQQNKMEVKVKQESEHAESPLSGSDDHNHDCRLPTPLLEIKFDT